jgi:predicted nucleotidyltransferase
MHGSASCTPRHTQASFPLARLEAGVYDVGSMLTDSQTRAVLLELERFAPIVVYVFGSAAQGRERADSDIDLAFLAAQACPPYDVFMASQRIATIVGRDVDLIDLNRVGDVMKVQVLGGGRRILVADPLAADTFEMLALSDYARLNEERRAVLLQVGVA